MVTKHEDSPLISKPNVNILFDQFASLDFSCRHLLITCESKVSLSQDMIVSSVKKFVNIMKDELKKSGHPFKGDLERAPDVLIYISPTWNHHKVLITVMQDPNPDSKKGKLTDQAFIYWLEKWLKGE